MVILRKTAAPIFFFLSLSPTPFKSGVGVENWGLKGGTYTEEIVDSKEKEVFKKCKIRRRAWRCCKMRRAGVSVAEIPTNFFYLT